MNIEKGKMRSILTEFFTVKSGWANIEEILKEAWLRCFWHVTWNKDFTEHFL